MIDRERFPDRRPSVTRKVEHEFASGKVVDVLVTFGFYSANDLRVRELFCADFKTGTDYHTLIMDASVLISRLLQHGNTPSMLLASLAGEPRSLLWSVLNTAAEIEKDVAREVVSEK